MQILEYLIKAISFYSFLILIRVMSTWFVPYNRPGSITYYLAQIVDPYLNLFRSRFFRVGMIDFSAIIAIVTLNLAESALSMILISGEFRFAYLLVMIIQFTWQYVFQFIYFVLGIILILKLIGLYGGFQSLLQVGNFLNPILYKLSKLIFKDRLVKLSTLVLIMLLMLVACYFATEQILTILLNICIRIPF